MDTMKSSQIRDYSLEEGGGIFEKKTLVVNTSVEEPNNKDGELITHQSFEVLPGTHSVSKEDPMPSVERSDVTKPKRSSELRDTRNATALRGHDDSRSPREIIEGDDNCLAQEQDVARQTIGETKPPTAGQLTIHRNSAIPQ